MARRSSRHRHREHERPISTEHELDASCTSRLVHRDVGLPQSTRPPRTGSSERSCQRNSMVEFSDRRTGLAAVVEGCVMASRCVPSHDCEMVNTVIAEMLGNLDPDLEFEIRDAGMHLHGPAVRRSLPMVRSTINLPVANPLGSELTVISGARRMAKECPPWLFS